MAETLPLIILFTFLLSFYLAVRAARSLLEEKKEPKTTHENTILAIRVPRGNTKHSLSAEQLFAALHGLLRETPEVQEHISFEIISDAKGIRFYCAVPTPIKEFVQGQIFAQYPDAEIKESPDYTSEFVLDDSIHVAGATVQLTKDYWFPIKTFKAFDVDPLAALTGSMSELGGTGRIWWQLMLRPLPDDWQKKGHGFVKDARKNKEFPKKPKPFMQELRENMVKEFTKLGKETITGVASVASPFPKAEKKEEKKDEKELTDGEKEVLGLIEGKLGKLGYGATVRMVAFGTSKEQAEKYLLRLSASLKQYTTATLNSFKVKSGDGPGLLSDYILRKYLNDSAMILNTEELASLFHFPNETVETPAIAWTPGKLLEPPLNLPISDCTYYGRTTYRDHHVEFGIRRVDRRRHMYIVGKTGTGKSELFKTLIRQDMENGEGMAIIDPHGQLVDEVLEMIPDHRVDDVVLFDPSDVENPVALNMLESFSTDPGDYNLLASGMLQAIKKNFESWGPRLEYLLNNSLLTLVQVERTTMLSIVRLLIDKNYRKYIVYKLPDPVLRDFWENEYQEFISNSRLATEAVAPIQNKVGRFLSSSTIRNLLGQAKSTLDLEYIMNNKKILLAKLSKGTIGQDNAFLLGSLLVSRINFATMKRAKDVHRDWPDFYLYVDEFQNFAAGDFAEILSEARKYKLSLLLTHQYTKQLDEKVLDAIIGNVGTLVALTLGGDDAEALKKEFEPYLTATDLISLEKYHFYTKLTINGGTSAPFSAVSIPPLGIDRGNGPRVVELSRQKYATNRQLVEERIQRWVNKPFDLGTAKMDELQDAARAATQGGESTS